VRREGEEEAQEWVRGSREWHEEERVAFPVCSSF
jgi:hypothetical protein